LPESRPQRPETPQRFLSEQLHVLFEQTRWVPISAVIGVLAGSASALLLWSLNVATEVREAHRWLIWLLAPAGVLVGLVYYHFGGRAQAGSNLIIDEIHDPRETIPFRMTPLVLLGTFLTHLFGGSAGREGTALQTGASLADQLVKPLGLGPFDRRIVLMAGLAGGFGSVFGVPLSGAVFGMEVLAIGSVRYDALAPCFVASFIGDLVTRAWHIHHTVFSVGNVPAVNLRGIVLAMLAGAVFGLTGMFFARLTHGIAELLRKLVAYPPLRPAVGGILVSCAVFALGTTRYIGLGVPVMVDAFHQPLHWYDWLAKLLFTAVTLGSGFKGGEVTPLFFIGATQGNALAHVLALPPSLLAGMGFVAVFAGAANTPIASTLMAVELFGAEAGAYAGIACVMSYVFSGHKGIYGTQRIGRRKNGEPPDPETTGTSSL
jgi:H+/Cl- antiporter ClcA